MAQNLLSSVVRGALAVLREAAAEIFPSRSKGIHCVGREAWPRGSLGIPCSRCPACIFGFVPGQTPTNGIRATFFGVCCDPLALSPPSFSLSRVKDGDFSSSPSLPSRALGKAPRLLGVGFGKGERRCCPIAGPICAAGIGSGDGEMR